MSKRRRFSGSEASFATRAIHGGSAEESLHLETSFEFASAEDARCRFSDPYGADIYTRWGNPTVRALEGRVAALEGAEDCVALASGMGAVTGALLGELEAGQRVLFPRGLYAETRRAAEAFLRRIGVEVDYVDNATFADPAELRAALKDDTALVWIESIANPTLRVPDIAGCRDAIGNRCLVVDSTFATPFHVRPLAHGADLVVHAATKAIGGHGDAVGGLVAGSKARVGHVRALMARTAGACLSPFNAWLIERGVRTLSLRAAAMADTAQFLAERLATDDRIAEVHYPGLAAHPEHDIAARQFDRGFGGLVAFEVRGGLVAGERLYDGVELITRAVSLGDSKTLLTHPATTTHASLSAAEREAGGISDGLLRMSVGLEDRMDLWADLDQALCPD
ncbi:MAG: aminotransferase class I/II-fold pyridoxal phosphate-dependent enzyme [Myxococcota bacterium]